MSQSHESLDRVVERLLDGRPPLPARVRAPARRHGRRRRRGRLPRRLRRRVRHGEQAGQGRGRPAGEPPEDGDRDPRRLQLAALHRQGDAEGWEKQAENAKLSYIEDINENDEFFAKVRQQLEAGQAIGRDLVVLDRLDGGALGRRSATRSRSTRSNVPNAKNLHASARSTRRFDRNRDFTLPWQSGITAIGYNPKKTGRKLTSINDLFDPKFKGRVSISSRLARLGRPRPAGHGQEDPTTATKDDLLAAIEKIDKANKAGQIRRFTGNDYAKDLAAGNLWACIAYSGDIVQLQADNPELGSSSPRRAPMTWSDNMMIPMKAKHPYGAETWMNYSTTPRSPRSSPPT